MLANVRDIVKLANEFGAGVYLDDAHASGVVGDGGRGSASVFGLTDQVDLISGTFSKSFASLGGLIGGDQPVSDFIRHHSPFRIFSAAWPRANVATELTSP